MLNQPTIKETLLRTIRSLKTKNILSAQLDAEILLAHLLKKSKELLYTYPEKGLTATQSNKYQTLIRRRLNSEPVAYLIGYKEFYGLNFRVNKNVLIPRAETELIVELVTCNLKKHETQEKSKKIIVDIGTGSGNIIISIAKSLKNYDLGLKNYEFYGIDNSKAALSIARKNAELHGVGKKIKFRKGNLLNPLIKNFTPKADQPRAEKIKNSLIITANLPYLTRRQYQQNKELHFEPKKALVGGKDGLEYIERLFQQIKKLLVVSYLPSGDLPQGDKLSVSVFIEIDPAQTKKIKTIIKKYFPPSKLQIKKDLCGRNRLVILNFN
ncbi:MAG: peptide chain release factor N(5)-glutamine methyltransferase [bacterium]